MVANRIRHACLVVLASAAIASAQPAPPAWIARSNENAQILLTLNAKYRTEGAARQGVSGLDEAVTQLPANRRESLKADTRAALDELRKRLTAEKDPLVAQDLQILVKAAQSQLDGLDLSEKYDIPYINVPAVVFSGLHALLDDQIPEARRKAALVRLRKYAGLEPGFTPLTEQAKARTRDWQRPGQIGPPKVEVEANLARGDFFINGIAELFARYKIDGYEEPFAKLKQQLTDYQAWTRREMLPAGAQRLPSASRNSMRSRCASSASTCRRRSWSRWRTASFDEWQREAQQIAARIAKDRGWTFTDYRDVIRELKKDQLVGDAILPHYQARLEGDRGDHRAGASRHPAGAPGADPACDRRRDRAAAGAAHGAAAADEQHRPAGRRSCCRWPCRPRPGRRRRSSTISRSRRCRGR